MTDVQNPVTMAPAASERSSRLLVALIAPHDSGHHAMYAAGYLQALLRIGCDVMLIAPHSLLEALPADAHHGAVVQRVAWDVADRLPPRVHPEQRAELMWHALGETLAAEAMVGGRYPSLVLLLYLDSFISELLGPDVVAGSVSCPVAGLWFKPPQELRFRWREQARRLVRFGRRYRLFRSPGFTALLLLDAAAAPTIPVPPPRIVAVPEFTDATLPAVRPPVVEAMRERAAGRRVCCLVGSIDARKGVRGFLEAAAAAPAGEWLFVIAGRVLWNTFDADVRHALGAPSGAGYPNVMLVDQWFEAEALNAIIAESDLLHACYDNWPYSSNMLCKAAALGTPVIARDEGYIGRNVRRFGLGTLVPPGTSMAPWFAAGFADTVASLAASPAFQAGCREYLAANDLDALVAALRPLIGELGCA